MGHLDSHCHLDDPRFTPDLPAVAARAAAVGVEALVLPGVTVAQFEAPVPDVSGLALYRAGGLHPIFSHPPDGLERLESALKANRLVAVGECGLDKRFRHPDDLERFHAQLDLALAYDRPVILHVVHAHEEVLAALKTRPLRGVVHAFAGSWTLAKRYLDRGFLLGIGGIGTWPTATRLRETLQNCPDGAYVLETDAPDLSPHWLQGARNEPAELAGIAQAVAALRGSTREAVLAASDAAGSALFGIPLSHV